jgi:hypothetical protein
LHKKLAIADFLTQIRFLFMNKSGSEVMTVVVVAVVVVAAAVKLVVAVLEQPVGLPLPGLQRHLTRMTRV